MRVMTIDGQPSVPLSVHNNHEHLVLRFGFVEEPKAHETYSPCRDAALQSRLQV